MTKTQSNILLITGCLAFGIGLANYNDLDKNTGLPKSKRDIWLTKTGSKLFIGTGIALASFWLLYELKTAK